MKPQVVLFALCLVIGCLNQTEAQKKKTKFEPTENYEVIQVEGWTVYVNRRLVHKESKQGQQGLKLLRNQLQRITMLVPKHRLQALQSIKIWLDDDTENQIHYHPERSWLVANGYNPDRTKCVDIGRIDRFLSVHRDQPFVVLHELAHGYHDQVLSFGDQRVIDSFRDAKRGKKYESVLRIQQKYDRHYALTNHKEYFAECTEAFLGTNDFYPFVRAELKEHDPRMYRLLTEVWLTEIKGQSYELSNHLPLAIMWPKGIKKPGRTVDDYVSFIDFAPTFIEAAGLNWNDSGMQPPAGRSLKDIFDSEKSGQVNPRRDHVLIGKERHDIGRPNDVGYPIRGIVKNKMLYLENFAANRWPGGDPETGYLNCDGSPTKTEILNARRKAVNQVNRLWQLSFGKRPSRELYDLAKDPDCVDNLVGNDAYADAVLALATKMKSELKAQNDPRIVGDGSVFDRYRYADKKTQDFYNRFMRGEKLRAGWVNPGDFEPRKDDGNDREKND